MTARLVAIAGAASGSVLDLSDQAVTIGRDADNALTIADGALSRRHCRIARTGAEWTLTDLGSFNGTAVNGQRVNEQVLADGDRITLGDTQLLFRVAAVDTRPDGIAHEQSATTRLRLENSRYLGEPAPLDTAPQVRVQQDLHALVRIGTRINRIKDRQTLQRALLDGAFAVVPATQGALLWLDAGDPEPQVAYTRSRDTSVPFRISHTVIGQAIRNVEAVLSKNALQEDGLKDAQSIVDAQVRSVMAVPLVSGDDVVGLIVLYTSDVGAPFDDLHLEVVTALAGIGAVALENVLRIDWLETKSTELRAELNVLPNMIGTSPAMQRVGDFIRRVGPTDSTVLLQGETGTGKELAARALHENSARASWPFVAVSCAALTETLLESELFGHERGAFTGAIATKRGRLEIADRGTLFLDEIGELSPALQAKLLRVIQEREVERVGGLRPIKVDIRLISATNRNLEDAVKAGTFRADLFFRLNVVSLDMPPLRARRQDIVELAHQFRAKFAAKRPVIGFSPAALRCLRAYDWPGNVRQLENVVERAIVLGQSPEIGLEDLPDVVRMRQADAPQSGTRFQDVVAEAKRRVILEALGEADGRVTEAARLLGLNPNYLHRLLGSLQLRGTIRLDA